MIDYRAGTWGFHVAFGLTGSLAPRALTMAIPNAAITFLFATLLMQPDHDEFNIGGAGRDDDTSRSALMTTSAFTSVMIFILYNRSNTAYDRWWEGGTLLQKTRGEWFNAYSSIMAFTSTKPELKEQVESYQHLLARLMSLLMCCGLQQVSPNRDRSFEIIDLEGIEPESMEFLNAAPDKVEIILQWIQRSMILHMQTGVLPVAPPILSRAFQEVSRGIVNLQNARKIADFPYPYPLAQVSMILQLLHYAIVPVIGALALPRMWAVFYSFFSIFVLWCIHFNALDLEFPFGTRVNDLPMNEMQSDWNKSICTLLDRRATRPPNFDYHPDHQELTFAMSDASDLFIPQVCNDKKKKAVSVIKVSKRKEMPKSTGGSIPEEPQGVGKNAASVTSSKNVDSGQAPGNTKSGPSPEVVDARSIAIEVGKKDDPTQSTPRKDNVGATEMSTNGALTPATTADGQTPKPAEPSSASAPAGAPLMGDSPMRLEQQNSKESQDSQAPHVI
eukprot:TRINITY_DN1821_c0_g2_i1.p1 TRINITY_DN1821_c0_g2~~TRINITY_DN1821_c0_g2_i1.p1  ORF type:complete len:502 (-),score=44.77 TRINITY_DN1821_c0_g2_i1:275-1780(-)